MGDRIKVAMVTGAGSGVGRASAVALASAGFSMVVTGRRLAPLEETAQMCQERGGLALALPADLTDPKSVSGLFARTRAEFGRLDLLFNNAGRSAPATPIDEVSLDTWQSILNTNLTAVFLATQEAFRLMKDQRPQGGRIINNGSVSAHVPRPQAAAYTASKHGVTGLTKSTALDGRPFRIACGQIDIGNAATDMTKRMETGTIQADGSFAPEPTMDVSAVASAIVYMASLPLGANVQFLTVLATTMPYIGRG
jgi:NAD(P)-dependent dehydrogenase (short-subunit alcohol dehydrogenase family)